MDPATAAAAAVDVLVVDDHADTAAVLARVVTVAGHRARTADTFAAAVEAARAGPVDLLLADLTLPDGDGCDLLAAVLAHRPACRGAALTGHVYDADRERCRRAGYEWFVPKPCELDAVLAVIAAAGGGAAAG